MLLGRILKKTVSYFYFYGYLWENEQTGNFIVSAYRRPWTPAIQES